LVASTIGYGLIAAALAWTLSDLLPILFGPAFAEATTVARWLAISPLLYGVYALGCNVLVTSDRRILRIIAQASGIAILIIAALLLVPRFGMAGAAGMLLLTQFATSALLWALVLWNRRSTHRAPAHAG
jgi:O-antigen/teichoic acid export membrane protein